MSIKTDKSKYEAEWKMRGWGPKFTCPSHYAKVYFDTPEEMEDWVKHNNELPTNHRWAKYFEVRDLETDRIVHRNHYPY